MSRARSVETDTQSMRYCGTAGGGRAYNFPRIILGWHSQHNSIIYIKSLASQTLLCSIGTWVSRGLRLRGGGRREGAICAGAFIYLMDILGPERLALSGGVYY